LATGVVGFYGFIKARPAKVCCALYLELGGLNLQRIQGPLMADSDASSSEEEDANI
jgi:hypothetical protein